MVLTPFSATRLVWDPAVVNMRPVVGYKSYGVNVYSRQPNSRDVLSHIGKLIRIAVSLPRPKSSPGNRVQYQPGTQANMCGETRGQMNGHLLSRRHLFPVPKVVVGDPHPLLSGQWGFYVPKSTGANSPALWSTSKEGLSYTSRNIMFSAESGRGTGNLENGVYVQRRSERS